MSIHYPSAKTVSIVGAAIVIYLFSMLRYHVGYDWITYENLYAHYIVHNVEDLLNLDPIHYKQGIVYNILFYAGKRLGLPFHFITAFYSFLTLSFLFMALNNLKHWWFSVFLFILSPGLFLNSFSIIKQGLAITIVLYLIVSYFQNKSKMHIFIVSLLAVSAHFTAIFPVITIYLMFNYNKLLLTKESSYYIALLLSFIVGVFIKDGTGSLFGFTPDFYAYYIKSSNTLFGSGYDNIKTVVHIFYIISLIRINFSTGPKLPLVMFNILFFGYCVYFIFYAFPAVTRLSYYFTVSQIILLPHIPYHFILRERSMVRSLVVSYFFLQYSIALKAFSVTDERIASGYSELVPYISVFSIM